MTLRGTAALGAQVEALEADLAAHASDLAADIAAGLVPPSAGRPRTGPEVVAGTNYVHLEATVDRHADRLAARLVADRIELAGEITTVLTAAAGAADPVAGVLLEVARLTDPTVDVAELLPQVTARLDATTALAVVELTGAAVDGYRAALAEAAAQGIDPMGAALPPAPTAHDVTVALGPALADTIAVAARRIGLGPLRTALEALAAAPSRIRTGGPGLDVGALIDALAAVVRDARLAGLTGDLARAPLHQAHSRGRHAAARRIAARLPAGNVDTGEVLGPIALAGSPLATDQDTPSPADAVIVYASELLDSSTCGPCSLVDGTEYPTLAEAEADYPEGTYFGCQGGDRCRGTLVYVWEGEAPPTVGLPPGQQPFPRPTTEPGTNINPPSSPPLAPDPGQSGMHALVAVDPTLGPAAAAVTDAVDAIAHLTPGLDATGVPTTRVGPMLDTSDGANGWYRPSTREIQVDVSRPGVGDTTTHELGHYLDNYAIGPAGRFASADTAAGAASITGDTAVDGAMRRWWSAVSRSDAYLQLTAARNAGGIYRAMQVPLSHLDYTLDPRELWARAWSQWVARHAPPGSSLGRDIDAILGQTARGTVLPYQWTATDFEPIDRAITALVRSLGWSV